MRAGRTRAHGNTGKSGKKEVSSWWNDLVERMVTSGREDDLEWLANQAVLHYPTGNYSNQALFRASGDGYAEEVELMLTLGARVNAYSKFGITSLHAAAAEGHTNIVNILIAHGADARAVSSVPAAFLEGTHAVLCQRSADMRLQPKDGVTPLMLAAGNGHLNVVQVLLSCGADVGAKDSEGRRAVAYASIRGHKDVVKALVAHCATSTPTLSTAEDGQGPVVRASSKDGAAGGAPHDLTHRKLGDALAMLMSATCRGDEAKVNEMLKSWPQLDVNVLVEGETALMAAVRGRHVGVVRKLLVEYHADPNMICTEGKRRTCLMHAAVTGDEGLLRLLLAHGANVHAKDVGGCTAVHHALASTGVVAVRSLEVLKAHEADLTAGNTKGITPLMLAVFAGRMEVVRYLLTNGADPTARDEKGMDAIAWAKESPEGSKALAVLNEAVIESLAAQIEGQANGHAQVHKDKSRTKKHRRKGEGAAGGWDAQAGGGVGGVEVTVETVACVAGGGDGGDEQQLQQVTAAVAVASLHEGEVEPADEEAEAQESVTAVAMPADPEGIHEEAPALELTEEDFDDAPGLFECPISHTVMRDPVAACDGYSYERSHIETWIRKAVEDDVALRSPMTNEAMEAVLNRNLVLKFMVDEYMERKLTEKKARLAAVATPAL